MKILKVHMRISTLGFTDNASIYNQNFMNPYESHKALQYLKRSVHKLLANKKKLWKRNWIMSGKYFSYIEIVKA